MDIFRKPATGEWHYDSAQKVATVEFSRDPWTERLDVPFDGTKDKAGERHTVMKLQLSEVDVERLHAGLVKGLKSEMRRLSMENKELEKQLGQLSRTLKDHLRRVNECRLAASLGSSDEKQYETLKNSLEKALEKINPRWRWSW